MTNKQKKRAFVSKFEAGRLDEAMRETSEWLDWSSMISHGTRVFLKPNLTYTYYKPGVTTSPAFTEAVVKVLKEFTSNIVIGESDGGYHGWKGQRSLAGHGLFEVAERYGVQVVDLSTLPAEDGSAEVAGRQVSVRLPSLLLHETDVFVTLPVPKIHAMTGVSLGFKNQWGCQGDTMRLRGHPWFTEKVLAINKLVRSRIAIFDGTYFLDDNGPMVGTPVRMDLVIASNDIGAGTLACCNIMGIDPTSIRHLKLAISEKMMPASALELEFNADIGLYCGRKFRLTRTMRNYITLVAFRTPLGNRLLYDSIIGHWLHVLLHAICGRPVL